MKFKDYENIMSNDRMRCRQPSQRIIQPHNLHRSLITPVQLTQPVHRPGVPEAALCHHSTISGVVYKEIGPTSDLVTLFSARRHKFATIIKKAYICPSNRSSNRPVMKSGVR